MNRFRPEQAHHAAPDSPAAHVVAGIMTAEDPDEISWLRSDLALALEEARASPARAATDTEALASGHESGATGVDR